MNDMIPYRSIYDAVCPVSRAVLAGWVKEGKVASRKFGKSKQHGRIFSKADVKRCWDELADLDNEHTK